MLPHTNPKATKFGRGGVGNFQSKQSLDDATRRSAEDEPETRNPFSPFLRAALNPAQHAKALIDQGRGGAGNLYQRPTSGTGLSPAAVAIKSPAKQVKPVMYRGRGGAGNHRGAEVEQQRKMAEERERARQDELAAQAEREVQRRLAEPPRAFFVLR
ncbi:MAG: hypothetical protein M1829_005118 [Trizodia sp. TS-e1964]|nr:MAG: hypothetical protein M1829_005118 [Trizodia sp. TS-e1964]